MARSFVAFVCIVGASSLRPENHVQMSSTDLAPQEILSSAQQLTDSMLQKRNATGHLSDEDAELCKNIINMIQASMYTSLRDAHQTDQTALTEAVDAIEFCNADIVERQNAKGDIGRLEHVAAGQQLTQTSLQSDYDTKKVADDAALSDLEGHMRSTSEFHQCVGVPVHRTTIAFDAFYEENAYVEEFLVKREEYRAKRGAQQLTKAALDEAARQLESSTASLHAEYCAWEAVLKSACESFEECYEKKEADLSALINSAKAREASRAEAYRTGEIVIANINFLLDQGAAPEADMEVDTSEFNLDIPATPEMATCDQGRLTDSRWNPPISCGNEATVQATDKCETFDFDPHTHCYPASKCSSCSYDFVDKGDGTRDFGNIHCHHHHMFYSKKSLTQGDLPYGYKFTCDHENNLHFGLRSMKNRNWAQKTWNDAPSWKYNLECFMGSLKHWNGGWSDISDATQEITMWIRVDGIVEFYQNGNVVSTGTAAFAASDFPIDMVISPPNNNHAGFVRNIGYVSNKDGTCT